MTGGVSASLSEALGWLGVDPPKAEPIADPVGDALGLTFHHRRPAAPGCRSLSLPEPSEAGIGDIRASRRQREMADVATPSALIRRAKSEWPEKCAAVQALAERLGIGLGEAWGKVLDAGISQVEDIA